MDRRRTIGCCVRAVRTRTPSLLIRAGCVVRVLGNVCGRRRILRPLRLSRVGLVRRRRNCGSHRRRSCRGWSGKASARRRVGICARRGVGKRRGARRTLRGSGARPHESGEDPHGDCATDLHRPKLDMPSQGPPSTTYKIYFFEPSLLKSADSLKRGTSVRFGRWTSGRARCLA
jgi:hypothetical protein